MAEEILDYTPEGCRTIARHTTQNKFTPAIPATSEVVEMLPNACPKILERSPQRTTFRQNSNNLDRCWKICGRALQTIDQLGQQLAKFVLAEIGNFGQLWLRSVDIGQLWPCKHGNAPAKDGSTWLVVNPRTKAATRTKACFSPRESSVPRRSSERAKLPCDRAATSIHRD